MTVSSCSAGLFASLTLAGCLTIPERAGLVRELDAVVEGEPSPADASTAAEGDVRSTSNGGGSGGFAGGPSDSSLDGAALWDAFTWDDGALWGE